MYSALLEKELIRCTYQNIYMRTDPDKCFGQCRHSIATEKTVSTKVSDGSHIVRNKILNVPLDTDANVE
jgi:hypothetical protein